MSVRRAPAVLALAVLALVPLTGCQAVPTPTIPAEPFLDSGSGDVLVELSRISDDVWVHTTYAEYEGARVPSNGLVVVADAGVFLVDTPWTPAQTEVLADLVRQEFGADITAALVTHAHPDRMGGAPYLRDQGIPISSLEIVATTAEATGYVVPDDVRSGDEATLAVGGTAVEIYYPGAGHTVDNTVVWLPEHGVLFGGCLVKEEGARTLGNTAEADVAAWPGSVRAMAERYPDADVVVPGHGPWGGRGLIEHTLDLLR